MDVWDCVGAAGAGLVLAGVSSIYWPAGVILGGLSLCAAYYLRESR
jgi:hypothetical protein